MCILKRDFLKRILELKSSGFACQIVVTGSSKIFKFVKIASTKGVCCACVYLSMSVHTHLLYVSKKWFYLSVYLWPKSKVVFFCTKRKPSWSILLHCEMIYHWQVISKGVTSSHDVTMDATLSHDWILQHVSQWRNYQLYCCPNIAQTEWSQQ